MSIAHNFNIFYGNQWQWCLVHGMVLSEGRGLVKKTSIPEKIMLNSNHFLFADMYYLLVPCLQLFPENCVILHLLLLAAQLQLVAAEDNISNLVSEHFICEETMIL